MGKRLRVLIADDDPVARRFLQDALGELGADSVCAGDGIEALDCLSASRCDMVLADLRMPGLGASALLDAWRSQPRAALAPIFVAMSGDLDSADRARLLQSGFADAVQKPLTLVRIQALLDLVSDSGPRDASEPSNDVVASGVRNSDVPSTLPTFDDAAALQALGSRPALVGLRALAATELPGQLVELRAARARGDHKTIDDILHRLRASCGFCGLPALAAACGILSAAHDSVAEAAPAWLGFESAASQALEALRTADE